MSRTHGELLQALRDQIEELTEERDAARAAADRLHKALADVSTWREDCHAHDADMGHEQRDFDEDEIARIERHAMQALEREKA